ncbi:hypothetical protein [Dongia sp.]|uniref:hypothetical protein n=1 Tax=Dongia sp. TaxID=1977262 RepID=UPI0035B300B3
MAPSLQLFPPRTCRFRPVVDDWFVPFGQSSFRCAALLPDRVQIVVDQACGNAGKSANVAGRPAWSVSFGSSEGNNAAQSLVPLSVHWLAGDRQCWTH